MRTDVVFHVHLHLLCSCHKHAYMSDLKENVLLAANKHYIYSPLLAAISFFVWDRGGGGVGMLEEWGDWWRAWKGQITITEILFLKCLPCVSKR